MYSLINKLRTNMEIDDTNECLELLNVLDIIKFCEETQEYNSEEEYEQYFEIEIEWNFETDSEKSNLNESVDNVEIPNTDDDDHDILHCLINIIELDYLLNSSCDEPLKRRERRWGVHPINQLRKELGHFDNLVNEMLSSDHDKFFNYTRMSPDIFNRLLHMVSPSITKFAPNAIPAKFRLILTLR